MRKNVVEIYCIFITMNCSVVIKLKQILCQSSVEFSYCISGNLICQKFCCCIHVFLMTSLNSTDKSSTIFILENIPYNISYFRRAYRLFHIQTKFFMTFIPLYTF